MVVDLDYDNIYCIPLRSICRIPQHIHGGKMPCPLYCRRSMTTEIVFHGRWNVNDPLRDALACVVRWPNVWLALPGHCSESMKLFAGRHWKWNKCAGCMRLDWQFFDCIKFCCTYDLLNVVWSVSSAFSSGLDGWFCFHSMYIGGPVSECKVGLSHIHWTPTLLSLPCSGSTSPSTCRNETNNSRY